MEEPQEAKLELSCQKIGLEPGMQIRELGCGWGSYAKYAAEKYGVHVLGVTVSAEQVKFRMEFQSIPFYQKVFDGCYRNLDN